VVRIIPAELVKPYGSVDRGSCSRGEGLAWWEYTLRGADTAAVEEWFSAIFLSRQPLSAGGADGGHGRPIASGRIDRGRGRVHGFVTREGIRVLERTFNWRASLS
jgi:hypothetical protein